MALSFFSTPHPDWVVEINHKNRVFGFTLGFVVLGVHMLGKDYGPLSWWLLGLQFLVYPQLLYWRTRASANGRETEMSHLTLDSFVFGLWAGYLGFPMWATFGMCVSTCINHTSYRGAKGALQSLAALGAGALVAVVAFGFKAMVNK